MIMLRCINPNEAKLLDAASGIHVKFRLAGVCIFLYLYLLDIGLKKHLQTLCLILKVGSCLVFACS